MPSNPSAIEELATQYGVSIDDILGEQNSTANLIAIDEEKKKIMVVRRALSMQITGNPAKVQVNTSFYLFLTIFARLHRTSLKISKLRGLIS